jgi:cytidylate kinase
MTTDTSISGAQDKDLGYSDFYSNDLFKGVNPSNTTRWPVPGPAITISNLSGSGAHDLAGHLAQLLQAEEPQGSPPWTVYDRQLVLKVLEEHNLPQKLAELMPEDRRSYFDDVIDESIGLRPPSWELVPKIIQTVRHLAANGRVILIGRAAGAVTETMPNIFHVRLIASLPKRIERLCDQENLSSDEAVKLIAKRDRGQKRYAWAYFHTRVDDDLHYHMVLNSDWVPLPDAARLIAAGARSCFQQNGQPARHQTTAKES